ncbi:hypothetical protein PIS_044 [Saccharomonospora phage PIS 136]|nr:hypothetical protein PIS_044 [Saccharomonospora phage PIS 136]
MCRVRCMYNSHAPTPINDAIANTTPTIRLIPAPCAKLIAAAVAANKNVVTRYTRTGLSCDTLSAYRNADSQHRPSIRIGAASAITDCGSRPTGVSLPTRVPLNHSACAGIATATDTRIAENVAISARCFTSHARRSAIFRLRVLSALSCFCFFSRCLVVAFFCLCSNFASLTLSAPSFQRCHHDRRGSKFLSIGGSSNLLVATGCVQCQLYRYSGKHWEASFPTQPTTNPRGATTMNEWTDVVDLTDDELQQINKHINRK